MTKVYEKKGKIKRKNSLQEPNLVIGMMAVFIFYSSPSFLAFAFIS